MADNPTMPTEIVDEETRYVYSHTIDSAGEHSKTLLTAGAVADKNIRVKITTPAGSATTPSESIVANPTVQISELTGLVTASVSASKSVTPTVVPGYISSGTAGTVGVNGNATLQLSTKAAQTYTPGTEDQTIPSGKYLTGVQTIKGDTDLVPENIADGVAIFGVTGTHKGGTEPVIQSINITENGDVTPPSGVDGYSPIHVAVPNTYTSADEGKVVQSGALVAQGQLSVNVNGTYDTTLYSEVEVNVQDGTLAKLGDSSEIVALSELYGPIVSGTDKYIRPVNHVNNMVTLNTTQPFEIQIRFKVPELPSASTFFIGSGVQQDLSGIYDLPMLYISATGTIGYYLFSGDRSTPEETSGALSDVHVQPNQWLTVRVTYNGTDLVLNAVDGTEEEILFSDFTPVQFAATLPILAGGNGTAGHLAAIAGTYVDITECYIQQDGVTIWGADGGFVLEPLEVTENGTYNPPAGVDGYAPVTVNVIERCPRSELVTICAMNEFYELFAFEDTDR